MPAATRDRLIALFTALLLPIGAHAQARRDFPVSRENAMAAVGRVCFLSGGQITHQDAYQLSCQTPYDGGKAVLMMLANNTIPHLSTEYTLVGETNATTVQIAEYLLITRQYGREEKAQQSGKKIDADMLVRLNAISSELSKKN